MKYFINLIIVSSVLLSFLAYSSTSGWKQDELTQSFMQNLTKDQCMAKTVASLKADDLNEFSQKRWIALSGISGDCITWAKGSEEQFCKTYYKRHVTPVCISNVLDARDCALIHIISQFTCFTDKYK